MGDLAIEAPAPPPPTSAWFAEATAGPAFATFGPVGGATENEHLVTSGSSVALGVGYGIERPWFRLDLGLRLQHIRLGLRGRFDLTHREPDFQATYDYVFPTVSATITTKLRSRVNFFGGLSLGTATFISDKLGAKASVSQIPIFGTFEGGLQLSVLDWLDVRPAISWLPPFEALNVVSTVLGVRARF
jgi:hypothetical protein